MSDHGAAVRNLIAALRAMGRASDANTIESEISTRGWDAVDGSDVEHVLDLMRAPPAPDPPGEDDDRRGDSLSHHPATAGYGPFIDALSSGDSLVRALDGLAGVTDFETARTATRALFVDLLGYEDVEVGLTGRLGKSQTIRSAAVVARHRGFCVTLAELSSVSRFTGQYQPLFRLQPLGIVIAVAPAARTVRLVYRRTAKAGDSEIRHRTLAGPPSFDGSDRHTDDNLLVWARRLDLMRPAFGDDAARLRDRAQHALDVEPGDLATDWASASSSGTGALPGISWEEAPTRELESFLQVGVSAEHRLRWGLERVFREAFPIDCRRSGWRIDYVAHAVGELPPVDHGPEEWVQKCSTRAAPVQLELRMVRDEHGAASQDLRLAAKVPVPDRFGRFVLAGEVYVHRPTIDANGGLVTRLLPGTDDDSLSEYLQTLYEIDESDTDQGDPTGAGDVEETDGSGAQHGSIKLLGTASLRVLLEHVVARKLAGVRAVLGGVPEEWLTCANDIGFILRRWTDADGALDLAAHAFLRAALEPAEPDAHPDHLRYLIEGRRWRDGAPPAWACPDLSRGLDAGQWWPVAGARLHPCGELSVPTRSSGDRELTLSVRRDGLFEVNPRLSGSASATTAPWWIARSLHPWSAAPVGTIESPGRASSSRAVPAGVLCVRSPGPRLEAWVAPGTLSDGQSSRHLLVRDLPTRSGRAAGRLLVKAGEWVEPGRPWLEVSATSWSGSPPPSLHRYEEAARTMLGDEEKAEPSWRLTIPADVSGVVVAATMATRGDIRGQGWSTRVTVEIARREPEPAGLVLPDGRDVPVVGELRPEDAPWRSVGPQPAVLVADPSLSLAPSVDPGAESGWITGETGEEATVAQVDGVRWMPSEPTREAAGPEAHLRRRLLDGAGLVERAGEPALTERQRRWIHASRPDLGARINERETTWMGGVPPHWPHLAEVVGAATAAPPRLGPPEWSEASQARPTSQHFDHLDRLRTRESTLSVQRTKSERDLLEVGCWCGHLRGPHQLAVTCFECGEPVTIRAIPLADSPAYSLSLPVPVLHPWRKSIAAALLGLVPAELDELVRSHGLDGIRWLLDLAGKDPLRSAVQRLRMRPDDPRRPELGLGLDLLQKHLAAVEDPTAGLWLLTLPVLPPSLLPGGYPAGASALTAAPIVRRYRKVSMHLKIVRGLRGDEPDAIAVTALASLQRTVDELFGPERGDSPPDLASLSSLLRRLWPPTRPGALRSAIPGLLRLPVVRREGERDTWIGRTAIALTGFHEAARADASSEANGDLPIAEGDGRLALVDASGIQPLIDPVAPPGDPTTPSWWTERAAFNELVDRHLVGLVAVASHADSDPDWDVTRNREPQATHDSARAALSALLQAVARPGARPSILVDLLEGAPPLALPREATSAYGRLVARLAEACPGAEAALVLGREVFAAILGGWWRHTVTEESPLGWEWHPPSVELEAPWQRAVPGLASRAWRASRIVTAAFDPTAWATGGARELGPALEAMLGFPTEMTTPVVLPTGEARTRPRLGTPPSVNPDHTSEPVDPRLGTSSERTQGSEPSVRPEATRAQEPGAALGLSVWPGSPSAWCRPEEDQAR